MKRFWRWSLRRRNWIISNLPIADTIGGLKEADYQGPYELELMGEELEQTDYFQLITNAHDKAKQWI